MSGRGPVAGAAASQPTPPRHTATNSRARATMRAPDVLLAIASAPRLAPLLHDRRNGVPRAAETASCRPARPVALTSIQDG